MTGNIAKKGFSLFEMVIVVGILGIIAMASVPVAEMTLTNAKEAVLEENLERYLKKELAPYRDRLEVLLQDYHKRSARLKNVSILFVSFLSEVKYFPSFLM